MLTNPSIPCPQCHSLDLVPVLTPNNTGGQDIEEFTCRTCRLTWKTFEDPQFPAAPNYRIAYAHAPQMEDEELALLLMVGDKGTRNAAAAATDGSAPGLDEQRQHLLRIAAYWDRRAHAMALSGFMGLALDEDVDRAKAKAVQSAFELLKHDLNHDAEHVDAPFAPTAPGWGGEGGGPRAYVRQEYKAWRGQQ
ncbi:hypothetical protein ABZS96_25865 [Streptomyces avermitilis]|uniref:hypothetical protein n=1 Tax=Streptomyces avermitilis TaxID=33903 RepID=UPI0033AEDDEA